MKIFELFTMLVLVLVLAILFCAVFGFVTAWAWNETMPVLFGLPMIDWWKGFALNVLGHMLFKSTSTSSSPSSKST